MCELGCRIYSQRPGSCRDYRCLWLEGHLGDEDRPDKLGVIFTTTDHPEWGTLIMLVECEPGAMDQARVKLAIDRIVDERPIVLMRKNQTMVLLPPQTLPQTSPQPVEQPVPLTIDRSANPVVAA